MWWSPPGLASNQQRSICASPEPHRRWPHIDGPRRLDDGEAPQLDDVKVIFRQEGPLSGERSIWLPHRPRRRWQSLAITVGDHWPIATTRRFLRTHIGKIVRVTPDGTARPTIRSSGDAREPEIGGYGHRNRRRRAASTSGKLSMHQHWPRRRRGNIPLAGKNYGWPVIGYGVNYDGTKALTHSIAKSRHGQHRQVLGPSIAPFGMALYTAVLSRRGKRAVCSSARVAVRMLVRLVLEARRSSERSVVVTQSR